MRMLMPPPKLRVFSCLLLVLGAGCGPHPASREAIAQALPAYVYMDTRVEVWDPGDSSRTVAEELTRMQARVGVDGKLRDNTGEPIEFFRRARHGGALEINWQQLKEDETRRLAELRKTHTVIITLPDYPGGIPPP